MRDYLDWLGLREGSHENNLSSCCDYRKDNQHKYIYNDYAEWAVAQRSEGLDESSPV